MNIPSLAESMKLLDEVVDINSVLVDPRVGPTPGSSAADELEAACRHRGRDGFWDEEPVRTVYTVAVMNYSTALEHARAIVALMSGEFTATPTSVLVRALIEVASQTWWLLEPDIGHVKRVCRLLALRYRSADGGESAARADGLCPDEYHDYTETTADIKQYAHDLGLEAPRVDSSRPWRVYVCGSERLPTASYRVKAMLKDIDLPSVYPILSGYSHGELFALWREFEIAMDGTQQLCRVPTVNELSFRNAVGVASYALHPPANRLVTMFGLERKADTARADRSDDVTK
ncbi:MAG: DUF5677 domain-containing protein [Streptosporangiaceae bacterium]